MLKGFKTQRERTQYSKKKRAAGWKTMNFKSKYKGDWIIEALPPIRRRK